jgi:hypothetical protein
MGRVPLRHPPRHLAMPRRSRWTRESIWSPSGCWQRWRSCSRLRSWSGPCSAAPARRKPHRPLIRRRPHRPRQQLRRLQCTPSQRPVTLTLWSRLASRPAWRVGDRSACRGSSRIHWLGRGGGRPGLTGPGRRTRGWPSQRCCAASLARAMPPRCGPGQPAGHAPAGELAGAEWASTLDRNLVLYRLDDQATPGFEILTAVGDEALRTWSCRSAA